MFFLSKILYLVPFKIRYQLIFLFLSFLIGIFLEVFSIGLILPVISALLSKESKIFEFDLLKEIIDAHTNTFELAQEIFF